MTQVLRGNIVHAPAMGRLDILEHGCLVLEASLPAFIPICPPIWRARRSAISATASSCSPSQICTSTPPSTPCWAWVWTCRCWTG